MSRRNPKKIRPYLNMFILKVSTTEDFQFVDDEDDPDAVVTVLDDIEALGIQFIKQVPGTIANNSKVLWMCLGNCNRGDLSSLIATHSLDWTIAAFEGQKIVQNRVLSHLNPDYDTSYDEDGDEVMTEVPITDCTGRLNKIAGHEWTY